MTRSPIWQRLRDETAAGHAAIETTLRFGAGPLDVKWYRHFLASMRRFAAGLASAAPADEEFVGAMETRARWLDEDLRALRDSVPTSTPDDEDAPAIAIPRLDSAARRWGARYVMEGSTLGGQSLLRTVDFGAAAGATRYLRGHGPETGARWRAFGQALADAVGPDSHAACVAAAQETFAALSYALTQTENGALPSGHTASLT